MLWVRCSFIHLKYSLRKEKADSGYHCRRMAEMEGFEPPDGVARQLISSQPRYDHFDTSPCALSLYPKFWEKSRCRQSLVHI